MRIKRKKTAWLLTALLVSLSVSCNSIFAPDEGELRGAVVDDCGRVVAGARVVTSPGQNAVTTGSDGRFAFKGLSTGRYTLAAEKSAYQDGSAATTLEETGGLSCAMPEGSAPTIVLTLSGWEDYANGDLEGAQSRFGSALWDDPYCMDAHNGLGWTYARLDSLWIAVLAFEASLAIDPEFLDALAGLALVSSAADDHDRAIASATAVLDEAGDGYVFRRDETVTSEDLRLLLAQSYFHKGQYTLAQEQVDLLDPDNGLDPADSNTWRVDGVDYGTYEEALLVVIHSLGS